ncbi:MAG: hypothetical protein HKN94_01050 [Acidimicrobiales bacterium]|nr:hypothetical protein [Acidimicrobiales bacterium]RZV43122.1 MAG: hypothetical protein EX269_13805 [Acidimicrobiales bacterium]
MVAQTLFLGEDLLAWLTLAFGGALLAGNGMALIKPPENRREDQDLEQAPLVRTIIFMLVGAVMTVWGLASLFGS